ncbi:3805_t:CDS:2 [Acaulospora morrowiae]|uniref:3805_t:CDS:1 n=1 Tax=Acaulospora morrowiae TaxID=94023 RepID=A0A9N9AH25_9GLOM|nr:3805_t:CDS:2 [Acaulospora morrowiae]
MQFFLNIYLILSLLTNNLNAFTPIARDLLSTIKVDDKVYFHGGYNDSSPNITATEFFYLDISAPFNVNDKRTIPWVNLSNITGSPAKHGHTACVGGTKKSSIFFIGNVRDVPPFVAQFDLTRQKWITSTNESTVSLHINRTQCVTSGDGIIYFLNGLTTNNLVNFNTINFTWTFIPVTVENRTMYYCSTTMMPDGVIIFIGGRYVDNNSFVSLEKFTTYNTTSASWGFIIPSGFGPSTCFPEGSVLTNYGHILIFGCGEAFNISVVDTTNNYTWIAPIITNDYIPKNLMSYSLTLIGDYVLMAFGFLYTDIILDRGSQSDSIYILNVSQKNNYTWITSLGQNSTAFPSSTPNTTENTSLVIDVSIGVVGGIFIVIADTSHLYSRISQSNYSLILHPANT